VTVVHAVKDDKMHFMHCDIKKLNKCVSKTPIDKRGDAVKTMCNTLASLPRATFPSLIV